MSDKPATTPPRKKPPAPVVKTPKVELYYDLPTGAYYIQNGRRFVKMKEKELRLQFISMGMNEKNLVPCGQGNVYETEFPYWDAFNNRAVDYAGALCGHRAGLFDAGGGRKILVTSEADGVWDPLPKKVIEPEFFSSFVNELLPGEQAAIFCHWLSIALRSMRDGDFRPGQVVVLAGPPECGKSFLQDMITAVLGGRSANPFKYMMDLTQFNNDLVSAEHWKIGDPPSSIDNRTRRNFGNNLKNGIIEREFPVHPKGKDALLLQMFRRVTISVNDETENLSVIPPLEKGINDKLMLFHCARVVDALKPFVKNGNADRKAGTAKLMEELPMIRAWLRHAFNRVPAEWQDRRQGIKFWHHPVLENELWSIAPEYRLLQVIDYVYYKGEDAAGPTDTRSFEIETKLGNEAPMQVQSLAKQANWCGTYLGKLFAAGHPRILRRTLNGNYLWTVKPPIKSSE